MAAKNPAEERRRRPSLGVQVTGYLEKKSGTRFNPTWKPRFWVLSHDALHCFKRSENETKLFGQEKGMVFLELISDLHILPEEPRIFRFKASGKDYELRARDEIDTLMWVRAIEEAQLDWKRKISLSSDAKTPQDLRTQLGRQRPSSGDYRLKQKYWPPILSVNVGEVRHESEAPPLYKKGVRWGETVEIAGLTPLTAARIRLTEGRYVQLSAEQLQRAALGAGGGGGSEGKGSASAVQVLEEVLPVSWHYSYSRPQVTGPKRYGVRVRWSSQLRTRKVQWETLPLPLGLILASSLYVLYLLQAGGLDLPNIIVWLLCVAMGLSALGSNVLKVLWYGRSARIWTLTPVAWEREISKPNDADEKDMPDRFLHAEGGNRERAVARWRQTLEWRRQHNVDTILEMPHPKFRTIKAHWPHFYHKRTKQGHPVYIERLGGIDIPAMEREGVSMEDLLRHYVYITEYLWEELAPAPDAKGFTILDCKGVNLRDARGPAMNFIRKATAFQSSHYPERMYRMFLINTPSWFSLVWSVVQTFVDKNTKAKIHIYSGDDYKAKLLEYIDADSLPAEYGGRCRCSAGAGGGPGRCQWDSEEELRLAEIVAMANSEDREASPAAGTAPSSPRNRGRGRRTTGHVAAVTPARQPRNATVLPSPSSATADGATPARHMRQEPRTPVSATPQR